jgi:single-stranded-DNA-specific exonuclease
MGLREIIISSGYSKIDSTTISFGVAPRINACGRMGHQEDALKLFLSNDIVEVKELTAKLNEYNKIRQETEKKIYKEAIEKIEKDKLNENNVIIVGEKGWHHGVIGIVSSKITDMYFKPSILLCYEEGFAKGSGRSIPGFDLYDALSKCEETLEKFGGHSMAVGVGLNIENIDKLSQQIEEIAKEKQIDKIVPILQVDAGITLDNVNRDLLESLKQLEPFGESNKMPIFVLKNLKIQSIRALSEGKHLKITLTDNKNTIDAIGFNMGSKANEYRIGDKVDVAGSIEINSFNGVDSIQINLKDIMKSL